MPEIPKIKFSEADLKKLEFLLKILGIKHNSLKKSHLLRRVRVRMMRTGCKSFDEYYDYIHIHKDERKEFCLAFSINVTRFFRNADTFEFIKQNVLPKIRKNVGKEETIKIWSAGCADGAEPYTLAILCEQVNLRPPRVKILATDFNQESLLKARRGLYPSEYLNETPADIQRKYFNTRSPDKVQISPHLHDYIDFMLHNLTSQGVRAPGARFDLIICRNVLIYFSREQQKEIFQMFYKALKPQGFMVLGRTEILHPSYRDKFEIYSSTHRIAKLI